MFSKITLMIGFMLLSTGALQAQDKPELEIGGAVRFNYNLSSWKEGQKNAEVILDMMSFVSMQSQVQRNAECRISLILRRFGGGMLKQGWLAYDFDSKTKFK
jgi:hypothetical protein